MGQAVIGIVKLEWEGEEIGDETWLESWPQTVKSLECHAKEFEFDSAGIWEPLT